MATMHFPPAIGEVDGLQVYNQDGPEAPKRDLYASHRDRAKVWRVADVLHRRGYGVHRETFEMEAAPYHAMNAKWVGPGDPPDDPLAPGG